MFVLNDILPMAYSKLYRDSSPNKMAPLARTIGCWIHNHCHSVETISHVGGLRSVRSRSVGACSSHAKPVSRHFYRLIYFSIPFLVWKKDRCGPVTQWRQLVSCDWPSHSHGSHFPGKFNLKINRSMKTPWQKYTGGACYYSSATWSVL